MTRVLLASVIANKPQNAGNAWVVLSWLRGFQRLGVEVHLVEDVGPGACADATGAATTFEASVNKDYFLQTMEDFGLPEQFTLVPPDGNARKQALSRLADVASSSDLLVNISGHLDQTDMAAVPRRRAYVDLDPGYTQIWHLQGHAVVQPHDTYFTVGANVPTENFTIPTAGIAWRALRQPVVLNDWPPIPAQTEKGAFTTVASWRGAFGRLEFGGQVYGAKAHEFRKFIDLPARCSQSFELAVDIHPADERDLDALHAHGWKTRDPRTAVCSPDAFRQYVRESRAEFSVAQGIYVETCSGWFSDRTTRYLASGRPALVQDTGFSQMLPVGEGLLSFRTLDEAVEGVRQLQEDYIDHARQARRLAEDYFDSDVVLTRFLEQAL